MATSTVFIHNSTEAVRLPAEMRLSKDVKQINVRTRGNERIITPITETWDSFFNADVTVSDDFMPARASQIHQDREAFE